MFQLLGILSEFERNLIKERSMAGLEAARKRGVIGSRKYKLTQMQQKALIAMYEKNIPIKEILKHFKISKTCFYNYLHKNNILN